MRGGGSSKQFPDDETQRRAAWRQWMRDNPMPRGDVGTVADHIDHVVKVAGIDHVGIGSDYDGVSVAARRAGGRLVLPEPDGRAAPPRLFSEADVKKVLGGNVLRVMREAETIARQIQKDRPPSMATTQPATLLKDLRPRPATSSDLAVGGPSPTFPSSRGSLTPTNVPSGLCTIALVAPEGLGSDQLVPARLQVLLHRGGNRLLDAQRRRRPLVMKPRPRHRRRQIVAEVDVAVSTQQHLRDDRRPAGGAERS